MAIKFFHTPKNKKFNFKPRYYNEQKEELEKRIEQIKQEMDIKSDDPNKPYVCTIRKGQMRGYLKKDTKKKQQPLIRLVLIIIVLLFIAYYLLYY
ncbi:MAG: hypothetical protein MI739_10555 [Bacteroidales bacterium]|nr:hypothetical protein [Bacteroidales bacterium]